MASKLSIPQDLKNTGLPALGFSDTVYNLVLVANTQQTYTIPAGIRYIRVATNQTSVFISQNGGTIAVPTVNGIGPELITSAEIRSVTPGDVIHCISAVAAIVSISCYS